ncbi:MAG: D-glycero-beta-D-manno-heptose 1-phosphate adenylyltransferase [Pyrinomonadaceae bacterium]
MDIIVFTNGCFDIIHPGHIDLLKEARRLGTKLVVGINSDRSVREIKGAPRPLLDQESRAAVLRELRSVDEVRIFDENTPERLIKEIKPNVLVKGGDWQLNQIIGADFVTENGGRVFSIPFKKDISTSRIVEKIQSADKAATEMDSSETVNTRQNFWTSDICGFFRRDELSNIERGAEIIAEVLARGGSVRVAGMSKDRSGAGRLAEDLAECFDGSRVLETNFAKLKETSFQNGDLLIAVGGGGGAESEEVAGVLMNARQAGCRIIVLSGAGGKKLAGLSDACLLIQAKCRAEILWRQSAIGYFWCLAVKFKMR